MKLKQRFVAAVVAQFHRPRGWRGWVAGQVMAHRRSNRERNLWAVERLDVQPHDRVLEIGFGPGLAIGELARRARCGVVCGVDHSTVMVDMALRRNAEGVRTGRVDLRLGSIEELPSFDATFDKVLAVNSIGFWANPVTRLVELRRVMRTDGWIAIVSQPRCPGATDETSAQAGRDIQAALEEAGFRRIRVETLALQPRVVCALGSHA